MMLVGADVPSPLHRSERNPETVRKVRITVAV